MINSDEIITYICLILSFINISLWFYVYFIDNNIIQYIIFIFTIFILLFITLIIYISIKKNSDTNIIIFDKFYYIRIGLIILNLLCYSFYIKYFLKDKSNIKKGGGFINNIIINGNSQGYKYEEYLKNNYGDLNNISEDTALSFLNNFYNVYESNPNDSGNEYEKELVFLLFINKIILKTFTISEKEDNNFRQFDKSEFYRILYNFINDEILFNSELRRL